jgi:glycopeptide antibiotics resistance protein
MLYDFDELALYVGLVILTLLTILLRFRKSSFSYMLCFWIFGIYLLTVLSLVVFPIYIRETGSDLPLIWWSNINLIPFNFGDCQFDDLCAIRNIQIIQNILLTIPFGFGISFVAPVKARDFIWLPLAIGLGFESAQFVTSLGYFHTLDINDVLLNAIGVFLGYAIFRLFGWLYTATLKHLQITPWGLFAYVDEVSAKSKCKAK